MSPELISPQRFGLKDSRPTKSSDCYALGMVIYETISGHLPFHKHADLVVVMKVSEGERPPRGSVFTDALWMVLELCRTPEPSARPNIGDVLQYLEGASQSWELPSASTNGTVSKGDDWDSESDSSGMVSPSIPSATLRVLSLFRSLLSPYTISTQCTWQRPC